MYNTLYIGLISLCLYHACITLSSVLGQCVFVMHCILLYVESGRRSRIGVYLSCVVTSMFSVGQGLGQCAYIMYCIHFVYIFRFGRRWLSILPLFLWLYSYTGWLRLWLSSRLPKHWTRVGYCLI